MHWSKTREVDYVACNRKFFYAQIAAQHNPKIAELSNRPSPALIRHEIVRSGVSKMAQPLALETGGVEQIIDEARIDLLKSVSNQQTALAEFTIVEACLNNFWKEIRPTFGKEATLYVTEGKPAEFIYDGLTFMVLPELVLRRADRVEILRFRTGKSAFQRQSDLKLIAGGLTCWARCILNEVKSPIEIVEIYLREAPTKRFAERLDDGQVRSFVENAKRISSQYAVSARIADFPANPSWATCRFCNFKEFCPDYAAFAESDFSLDALNVAAPKANTAAALYTTKGETRNVFLSHCSEDKEEVVRPFARALEAAGIGYWLDEAEIEWGDGLTRKLNQGLATSDFVVTFLTPNFMQRGWPEAELSAALNESISERRKKLLPIYVGDRTQIVSEYPLLRDLKGQDWTIGIPAIIQELKRVLAK